MIAVDLWLWRREAAGDEAALSPAEHARAARFAFTHLARDYRAIHARLRAVLARYGKLPAAAIEIWPVEGGKPAMTGGPFFNLSHSGDWVALAVCASVEVGVDIEAHRTVEPDVAERFFSPAERQALNGLAAEPWRDAFFRCWTRKEAFVKATGEGLMRPLDSFDVTLLANDAARLTRIAGDDARAWTLIDLPFGPGMAGAIALRSGGAEVRLTLREGQLPLPG